MTSRFCGSRSTRNSFWRASAAERLAQLCEIPFRYIPDRDEVQSAALPFERADGLRRRTQSHILAKNKHGDSMRALSDQQVGRLIAAPVHDASADEMERRRCQIGHGH